FDGLSWDKLAVKTGDGEEPFSTNGLVAQWNFNETSGTSLADSSGNNKTGALVNFANTSGQDVNPGSGWTSNNKRWGTGALMFDGTNDYVNIGGTGAFNTLTIPFSVDGWIYLRDGNPNWAPIFSSDDQDTDTGNYYGFYFRVGTSKQLDITFGNGVSAGGDGRRSYGGGPEILLGQWTHVAATVNGPEEMKLYVNGIEISGVYSGSATTMAHNNAYTARIGRMTRYGPFYMNGAVDSLRIYSRILPASEIVSNYQAGMIEFQTRTGATSSPNDGSWEEWKPITGESQLLSLDSDAGNWSWNSTANMAPLSKADVDDIKTEGSGSMGLIFGSRYSSANTVGLWKMEETSGTGAYIKDSGNSGADLTPSGTTVVNGFFGKTRRFNGTSDYLSCSDANCGGTDKLDITGSLTIEAWIYPESPTGTRRIVSKWSSSSSGTYFLTYSESTNYTPRFLVRGATQAYRDASVSVPIKAWTHVAGVYDAGARTLDVYVNGRLSNGSLSGTVPSSLANSNDDFYIGAERSGTNLFSGKIDEVRIMSTALTAATIEQSYRASMGHYLGRTISSTNLSDKT
ncbi:MAG: LamG domain-containing protein, partial [Candidatus Shapirobacteria bacterium]|nr:LamG domain-containing protein [Candidatus Shapirobacteria bacterium]